MVSLYKYAKADKSMYHTNGSHKHYSFASSHSFDSYVEALYLGLLKHDEHSRSQSYYLRNMYGKCKCKYILRFENLNQEIIEKLGFNVNDNKKINSSDNKTPWKEFYKNSRTIQLVNKIYKDDFRLFGYVTIKG